MSVLQKSQGVMKRFSVLTVVIAVLALNICCPQASVASELHYLKQRAKIIKSDEISLKMTPEEQLLDRKLDSMKKDLLKSYNGAFPYDFPVLNDKRLTESALYRFSERLPKGSDLHVHGSASMSAADFYNLVSNNPNIYICSQQGKQFGALTYIKPNDAVPDGYISLVNALNKKIYTKEELLNLWTVSPFTHNTQTEKWSCFESLFEKTDIIDYLDNASALKYYYQIFKKYCENNILHVEFHRVVKTDVQDEIKSELIIRQAYYDVKKEYPDFNLKIIASGLKSRYFDFNEDLKRLDVAKKVQSEIKDESDKNNTENFIIGYDLVNEEDSSRSLFEYSQYLEKYRSKDFNLYLHAGESLNVKNHNLADAYLLKSKRVGHGYNLYMFPDLLEKYKKANIALEVCPLSNIRLGYVSDLRQHPMIEYLKRGLPVVIASDDPLFFENKTLTDDWFAVILSFDLSVAEIKQLCLNSILYSGVSKKEKTKLLSAWEKQWTDFVNESICKNRGFASENLSLLSF